MNLEMNLEFAPLSMLHPTNGFKSETHLAPKRAIPLDVIATGLLFCGEIRGTA